mgnify:CR=1 FL=1
MVNATVDNEPVSIMLDVGQSTTVPSNETWRVSIHLCNAAGTRMSIAGIGDFISGSQSPSGQGNYLDVTLIGGQTIASLGIDQQNGIFITGFVVDS